MIDTIVNPIPLFAKSAVTRSQTNDAITWATRQTTRAISPRLSHDISTSVVCIRCVTGYQLTQVLRHSKSLTFAESGTFENHPQQTREGEYLQMALICDHALLNSPRRTFRLPRVYYDTVLVAAAARSRVIECMELDVENVVVSSRRRLSVSGVLR